MRLLIATDSFPPKIDGVSDMAAMLGRELSSRGHQVRVLAPAPGPAAIGGARVVRLHAVPAPLYPEVRLATAWPTLRKYARRRFDAALVLTLGPIGIGTALALPPSTRLLHIYTTDIPSYLRAYHLGLFAAGAEWITRVVGRRAATTLCPTEHVRAALERIGVPSLQVWGRGVDTQLFRPERRSAAMRQWLTNDQPTHPLVVYVGRLAREKRLLDLLEATRRLPYARFAFVGDGPQRAELERLFPAARTVFTGYLRGEPLAEAFASADVFAFPSDSDTFAQVVLQAMASGVPPVVAAGTAPASFVTDGQSGIHAEVRSGSAFADAIGRLTRNGSYRAALGTGAFTAAQAFSWKTLIDRIELVMAGNERPAVDTEPRLTHGVPV